jgi:hypothetical protein
MSNPTPVRVVRPNVGPVEDVPITSGLTIDEDDTDVEAEAAVAVEAVKIHTPPPSDTTIIETPNQTVIVNRSIDEDDTDVEAKAAVAVEAVKIHTPSPSDTPIIEVPNRTVIVDRSIEITTVVPNYSLLQTPIERVATEEKKAENIVQLIGCNDGTPHIADSSQYLITRINTNSVQGRRIAHGNIIIELKEAAVGRKLTIKNTCLHKITVADKMKGNSFTIDERGCKEYLYTGEELSWIELR